MAHLRLTIDSHTYRLALGVPRSFHAQTPAAILDPHTSEGDAVIAAREARKGPPKEDAPGLARRYPKLAQFGTTFLAMKVRAPA